MDFLNKIHENHHHWSAYANNHVTPERTLVRIPGFWLLAGTSENNMWKTHGVTHEKQSISKVLFHNLKPVVIIEFEYLAVNLCMINTVSKSITFSGMVDQNLSNDLCEQIFQRTFQSEQLYFLTANFKCSQIFSNISIKKNLLEMGKLAEELTIDGNWLAENDRISPENGYWLHGQFDGNDQIVHHQNYHNKLTRWNGKIGEYRRDTMPFIWNNLPIEPMHNRFKVDTKH